MLDITGVHAGKTGNGKATADFSTAAASAPPPVEMTMLRYGEKTKQ
jgi:hypothetical protein